MDKLQLLAGLAALCIALPASAAEDPIAVRQALMDGNGAAAAVGGGMLKDEIDYNPLVAKAAIAAIHGTAEAVGDYFPEGSLDPGQKLRLAENLGGSAGFQAQLTKFREAAASANAALGQDRTGRQGRLRRGDEAGLQFLPELPRDLPRRELTAGCGPSSLP